jgi:hypothetical protein
MNGAPAPPHAAGGRPDLPRRSDVFDETTPTAVTVQLHTETITRVEAHELEDRGGRFVTLTLGDDRSGINVIGDPFTMRRLVAQATLALISLPHAGTDIAGWTSEEHDFACRVIHGMTAAEIAEGAITQWRRTDEP